ncbi:UNVERIFIED_CONTAM: Chaperone protein DnaJ [Sesamum angustifolium]|uniref:Chaperone protein DnaJ n=1 Tax=Sesamum angustifolium TaxID=2727405 RepID=A0AAW2LI07_9LAMI
MECNKDEALRAKSIAESKLEKKDFAGAKKIALKAQALYPGLDGISQMLTTVDVYVSAQNKISGEIDWYGVLGVSPSSDDETIRKQYRKLALMLHPDKNKSVGSDGAFKLISEAWSLLSDKAKRLAYNQRRGSKGFQQKVQVQTGGPSAPSRPNGVFNFASRTASAPKTQNTSGKAPPTPAPTPSHQRTDTFWTICHRCKMHYEYLKMYLNHTLLCPNCHEAFMASETAPPFNYSKASHPVPRSRQQTSSDQVPSRNAPVAQKAGPGQAGSSSSRHQQYQQDLLSRTASAGGRDPSIAAKAANVVQQAQDKLKRASTESHAPSGWEGYVKKRKLDEESSQHGMNYNMGQGSYGFGTAPGSRIYGFSSPYRQPNSTRDLTPIETRNMLIVNARKEIRNKLNMWKSETTTKAADKEKDMTRESKKERRRTTANIEGHDQNGNSDLSATKADQPGKGQVSHSANNASEGDAKAASMTVPDPDFHDFDQDRTESSFGDNEVWAAYDDDDGMPRFYALISKVMSRKPFKLRISWLNSRTNSEFSTIDWVGSGFYKTSGEFRVGRYEICKSINSFSQKVNWSKGPRGSVLIFPQKGDVWAVYKNWSSDWNGQTPEEVIHKYEMVTVLDDYSEEQGVSVAPLVKVVGFKTVFRPNLDPEMIKRIPKEEMFRFSHRVPKYSLTGLEAQNAPKGCLELDPAATPLELLQVITESNEVQTEPKKANADEDVLQSVPSSSSGEIASGANAAQAVNIAESK